MGHRWAVNDQQRTDPAIAIALAWQPRESRPALAALFDLDRRLAGVVARAKEPLLAQMRLAWWRDQLAETLGASQTGEPLLAQIAARWGQSAESLRALVDGWENLIGEAPLSSAAIAGFAAGRGHAFAAFATLAGAVETDAAAQAGRCWAFADLCARNTDARERDIARTLGREIELAPLRSRALRGLAVIGGLSRRALIRGEPPMHGRAAALAAMRLGMLGR